MEHSDSRSSPIISADFVIRIVVLFFETEGYYPFKVSHAKCLAYTETIVRAIQNHLGHFHNHSNFNTWIKAVTILLLREAFSDHTSSLGNDLEINRLNAVIVNLPDTYWDESTVYELLLTPEYCEQLVDALVLNLQSMNVIDAEAHIRLWTENSRTILQNSPRVLGRNFVASAENIASLKAGLRAQVMKSVPEMPSRLLYYPSSRHTKSPTNRVNELPLLTIPEVKRDAMSRNYGRFIISPLEAGYGITLGNSLRRVLLSSLSGAAITSIRISDVLHEFSDIPGVKEDTMQVLLQIKNLRLILHEGETARLRLDLRGEGTVTAADIVVPAEVEIVNPDLYLFTVDNDRTKLEIEMTVGRGRGYSPAEERGRLPIGEIPVDAIYSPIRRVNYTAKNLAVKKGSAREELVLEIWTDGTIKPEAAMNEAGKTLINHLQFIASISDETLAPVQPEVPQSTIPSEIYETPIEQLDLSVRVFNSLKRTGITTVGEVLDHLGRGPEAMLSIRNFGEKSLNELHDKLREKGYLKENKGLEVSQAEPQQSAEAASYEW